MTVSILFAYIILIRSVPWQGFFDIAPFYTERPSGVDDDDQSKSDVGQGGQPHRRNTKRHQQKNKTFQAQRQHDILPDDVVCFPRKGNGGCDF